MTHRIFATALLVGLISLNASAQQGNSIRGKVRNSSGVNISQVIVGIETGNGSPFTQTVTNNEGDFFFGGLTDTSYVLVISAPDYNPVSEHVDFVNRTGPDNPGESRTVDITLTPRSGVGSRVRPRASFVQDVPKAARDAFERAVKLARENKSEEALASIGEAIKIFPDYFEARFVLANELAKQGKFDDAIKQLNEAQRINPKDDRVWSAFGTLLLQQRKYSVAARVFAQAANLNPLDAQYSFMQGFALIDQAAMIEPNTKQAADTRNFFFAEAEKALLHAYEVSDNKLAVVHLQLARLYEKKGDRNRAAGELEQYLKSPEAKNSAAIREAIRKLRAPDK